MHRARGARSATSLLYITLLAKQKFCGHHVDTDVTYILLRLRPRVRVRSDCRTCLLSPWGHRPNKRLGLSLFRLSRSPCSAVLPRNKTGCLAKFDMLVTCIANKAELSSCEVNSPSFGKKWGTSFRRMQQGDALSLMRKNKQWCFVAHVELKRVFSFNETTFRLFLRVMTLLMA